MHIETHRLEIVHIGVIIGCVYLVQALEKGRPGGGALGLVGQRGEARLQLGLCDGGGSSRWAG